VIHCQDTGGGGARPVPIENDPVKSIPKGLLKTISGLAAFMRECLRVLGTEITHGATLTNATAAATAPAAKPAARNGKKKAQHAEAA